MPTQTTPEVTKPNNPFITEELFAKEVTIREGKVVHLRKWKAKDRNRFKAVVEEKGDNLSAIDISRTLVFPCIQEKDILLTEEEIKFISSVIREISISPEFNYTYVCTDDTCNKTNKVTIQIKDVNKPVSSPWAEVDINGGKITFGERVKPQFYYETLFKYKSEAERSTVDLAMHIVKVQDDDSMSFKEIITFLEDLDTDIIDKIQEEYNKQKFTQDNITELTCEACGKKQKFIFDEIDDFFPKTWFN